MTSGLQMVGEACDRAMRIRNMLKDVPEGDQLKGLVWSKVLELCSQFDPQSLFRFDARIIVGLHASDRDPLLLEIFEEFSGTTPHIQNRTSVPQRCDQAELHSSGDPSCQLV